MLVFAVDVVVVVWVEVGVVWLACVGACCGGGCYACGCLVGVVYDMRNSVCGFVLLLLCVMCWCVYSVLVLVVLVCWCVWCL